MAGKEKITLEIVTELIDTGFKKAIKILGQQGRLEKRLHERRKKFVRESINDETKRTKELNLLNQKYELKVEQHYKKLTDIATAAAKEAIKREKESIKRREKLNKAFSDQREIIEKNTVKLRKRMSKDLASLEKKRLTLSARQRKTTRRKISKFLLSTEKKLSQNLFSELNKVNKSRLATEKRHNRIRERIEKKFKKKRLDKIKEIQRAEERAHKKRTQDLRSIPRHMKRAVGSLNAFGGALLRIGSLVSSLSSSFMQLATTVAQTGAGFEQSIRNVGAILNVSDPDLIVARTSKLEKEARKLGASTAYTATEVAEGMGDLARAGLKADKIIGAIAPSLYLAGGAGADLTAATKLMARTMAQFNLQANDAKEVADVFTIAMQNSLLNMQALDSSMRYAGSSAGAFGWNIKETSAVVAIFMDQVGLGSTAGTQFRHIMKSLGAPTTKAKKLIDRLAKSMGRTSDQIRKDLNPQTSDFVTIMETLKPIMEDTEALTTLVNKRSSSTLQKILSDFHTGATKYHDLMALFENQQGQAQRTYEAQIDTVLGQTKIVRSQIQELFLSIFDGISPSLRRGLESLRLMFKDAANVVKFFAADIRVALSEAFQMGDLENTVESLGKKLGIVIVVFLKNIGKIPKFLKDILQKLISIGKAVAYIWLAANFAFLIAGIGAVIKGVYLLVTALPALIASLNALNATLTITVGLLTVATGFIGGLAVGVLGFKAYRGDFNIINTDLSDLNLSLEDSISNMEKLAEARERLQTIFDKPLSVYGMDASQVEIEEKHFKALSNIEKQILQRPETQQTKDALEYISSLKKLNAEELKEKTRQGELISVSSKNLQRLLNEDQKAFLKDISAKEDFLLSYQAFYSLLEMQDKKGAESFKKRVSLQRKIVNEAQKNVAQLQKLGAPEGELFESVIKELDDFNKKLTVDADYRFLDNIDLYERTLGFLFRIREEGGDAEKVLQDLQDQFSRLQEKSKDVDMGSEEGDTYIWEPFVTQDLIDRSLEKEGDKYKLNLFDKSIVEEFRKQFEEFSLQGNIRFAPFKKIKKDLKKQAEEVVKISLIELQRATERIQKEAKEIPEEFFKTLSRSKDKGGLGLKSTTIKEIKESKELIEAEKEIIDFYRESFEGGKGLLEGAQRLAFQKSMKLLKKHYKEIGLTEKEATKVTNLHFQRRIKDRIVADLELEKLTENVKNKLIENKKEIPNIFPEITKNWIDPIQGMIRSLEGDDTIWQASGLSEEQIKEKKASLQEFTKDFEGVVNQLKSLETDIQKTVLTPPMKGKKIDKKKRSEDMVLLSIRILQTKKAIEEFGKVFRKEFGNVDSVLTTVLDRSINLESSFLDILLKKPTQQELEELKRRKKLREEANKEHLSKLKAFYKKLLSMERDAQKRLTKSRETETDKYVSQLNERLTKLRQFFSDNLKLFRHNSKSQLAVIKRFSELERKEKIIALENARKDLKKQNEKIDKELREFDFTPLQKMEQKQKEELEALGKVETGVKYLEAAYGVTKLNESFTELSATFESFLRNPIKIGRLNFTTTILEPYLKNLREVQTLDAKILSLQGVKTEAAKKELEGAKELRKEKGALLESDKKNLKSYIKALSGKDTTFTIGDTQLSAPLKGRKAVVKSLKESLSQIEALEKTSAQIRKQSEETVGEFRRDQSAYTTKVQEKHLKERTKYIEDQYLPKLKQLQEKYRQTQDQGVLDQFHKEFSDMLASLKGVATPEMIKELYDKNFDLLLAKAKGFTKELNQVNTESTARELQLINKINDFKQKSSDLEEKAYNLQKQGASEAAIEKIKARAEEEKADADYYQQLFDLEAKHKKELENLASLSNQLHINDIRDIKALKERQDQLFNIAEALEERGKNTEIEEEERKRFEAAAKDAKKEYFLFKEAVDATLRVLERQNIEINNLRKPIRETTSAWKDFLAEVRETGSFLIPIGKSIGKFLKILNQDGSLSNNVKYLQALFNDLKMTIDVIASVASKISEGFDFLTGGNLTLNPFELMTQAANELLEKQNEFIEKQKELDNELKAKRITREEYQAGVAAARSERGNAAQTARQLVDNMINESVRFMNALVKVAPIIIQRLIEKLPDIINALRDLVPKLAIIIDELWPVFAPIIIKLFTLGATVFAQVAMKLMFGGGAGMGAVSGTLVAGGIAALLAPLLGIGLPAIAAIAGGGALLGGVAGSFNDTPNPIKVQSQSGMLARFAHGDTVIAAKQPQELLRQALEAVGSEIKMATSRPPAGVNTKSNSSGGAAKIDIAVIAEGRVLDAVQMQALERGHAPKIAKRLRKASGVKVGFNRGRYNKFAVNEN